MAADYRLLAIEASPGQYSDWLRLAAAPTRRGQIGGLPAQSLASAAASRTSWLSSGPSQRSASATVTPLRRA